MIVSRSVVAALCCFVSQTLGKTVTYDFSIGWVRANPDGAFERDVIGINGQWPIPTIEADVGDTVVIRAKNDLKNQPTSLHFHGLYLESNPHMDGPSSVTQCPILPGESFTYEFTINQPGTYWYHSHTDSQYPDGLRGPLVVHDPHSPFLGLYDDELVISLSDWYHDEMKVLLPQFISKGNPTGAEPVPQAALMNETQNLKVPVATETTYLVRFINMGAFAGQYVWIEGHEFSIVEVDGIYTKPAVAKMVYLAAGQRCSILLTTRGDSKANFPIVASMDTTLFDVLPDDLDWNVTGWLVYDEAKTLPKPVVVHDFEPYDDFDLAPQDSMELLPEPDHSVVLQVEMANLGDGANYAFFNDVTYRPPKVPTLYTALSAGDLATNSQVYGKYTSTYVLEKDEVVQIVVNNLDDGRHPFHLHGHTFQALVRSEEDAGLFNESAVVEYPGTPMRRDTLVVEGNGNMVLRFRADNPGVWLFHCHIEWHVSSGLIATFVEAPLELQKTLTIPEDHLAACEAAGVPTSGNAAGNTKDFLDLTGQNVPPAPLPEGFTLSGSVAFLCSTLMGLIGVYVIASYGLNTPEEKKRKKSPEREPLLATDGPVEDEQNGESSVRSRR